MDANNNAQDDDSSSSHGLSKWRRELITKDDPLHLHKTLGLLCLISFVTRFFWQLWRPASDMAFASHPEWTLVTLVLHVLLNMSSFEFRIPSRRIASGYRIWPEYRVHSLTFLLRSIATMAITWYEETWQESRSPNYGLNLVVVLATMAVADLGSYYCGTEYQSGFARQLDVRPAVKYFFSVMQFGATAVCLYGVRRYSLQFLFCMIIQCNAFFMTLRRKNLAGHTLLVSLYGIMLATGFVLSNIELARQGIHTVLVIASAACTAATIRLAPPLLPSWLRIVQNKYMVWIIMYRWMQYWRWRRQQPLGDAFTEEIPWELYFAFFMSHVCMFALGYYKCIIGYSTNQIEASQINYGHAKTS